jgi:hypothetical protein
MADANNFIINMKTTGKAATRAKTSALTNDQQEAQDPLNM